MQTECDEIVDNLLNTGAFIRVSPGSFDDCLRQVRDKMPGESETVINNVAWSLYQLRPPTAIPRFIGLARR